MLVSVCADAAALSCRPVLLTLLVSLSCLNAALAQPLTALVAPVHPPGHGQFVMKASARQSARQGFVASLLDSAGLYAANAYLTIQHLSLLHTRNMYAGNLRYRQSLHFNVCLRSAKHLPRWTLHGNNHISHLLMLVLKRNLPLYCFVFPLTMRKICTDTGTRMHR